MIPKSVRPIIDIEETILGNKEDAKKQYRIGNLHVREYNEFYSLHVDQVDPRDNPLGHLIKDAPDFLIGLILFSAIGLKIGRTYYNKINTKDKKIFLPSSKELVETSLATIGTYMLSKYILLTLKRKDNHIYSKDK
ncbi:MAG: hypothetical protein R3321_02880 [Nitrososphaeraceae archaeon]|nr:hypothetical protein [Nitrososphaeraceae archaeon]